LGDIAPGRLLVAIGPSPQIEEVSVAGERALVVLDGSASALFGLGPAMATADREHRLNRIMKRRGLAALRWCNQVHGSTLRAITQSNPLRPVCIGDCDGLITALTDLGLLVWTADCVPVVLVTDSEAAAVHAGWRGCAAGIVPAAVHRLLEAGGASPHHIRAYLGPAISGPHYQVGPEVITALTATGVPSSAWLEDDRVDLREFLDAQLRRAGVDGVTKVGGCTYADSSLASYRRDGDLAGRQWSLVYRRAVERFKC
jgi:YfiH family protein